MGSQDTEKIYGDKNYYYDGTKSANKSGSIDMQGLLQPTDVVPEGVGARLDGNGTSSGKLSRTRSSAEIGIPSGSVPSGVLGKLGCKDEEVLESFLAQDTTAKARKKLGLTRRNRECQRGLRLPRTLQLLQLPQAQRRACWMRVCLSVTPS